MSETLQKHRHFLVAPFFVAMLFFSLVVAMGVLRSGDSFLGAAIQIGEGDLRVFSHSSGVGVLPFDTVEVDLATDAVTLHNGSVLIGGTGLVPLTTHTAVTFAGFGGAYHVTLNGQKFDVAAITTPVVIGIHDQYQVVPAGYQWSYDGTEMSPLRRNVLDWIERRELALIPKAFQRRQLEHVPDVMQVAPVTLPLSSPHYSEQNEGSSPLQLPAAAKRAKQGQLRDYIAALRYFVEERDIAALQHHLKLSDRSLLQQPRGQQYVGSLLATLQQQQSGLLDLIRVFAKDDALFLLASVHENLRDAAWLTTSAHRSDDVRLLRLVGLPHTDIASLAASQGVYNIWNTELIAFLETENGILLADAVFLQLAPLTAELERRKFPERSQRLTQQLAAAFEEKKVLLSEQSVGFLSSLSKGRSITLNDTKKLRATIAIEHAQIEDAPILSKEELEEEARALLSDAGGIFTIETLFTPGEGNVVRVESIVFATSEGYENFIFDLDVPSAKLHRITQNGTTFPNAMTLTSFTNWVETL